MAARVVVIDPVHYYRMGVVAALTQAGLDASDATDDVDIDMKEVRAVVLSVRNARDLARIRTLRTQGCVAIVALVAEDTLDEWVAAISAGAHAVVHRRAHPDLTLDALRAAMKGMTLVPTDVVRSFIAEYQSWGDSGTHNGSIDEAHVNGSVRTHTPHDAPTPDDRDVQWLRRLSEGATVAKLAQETFYSEREMYRILSSVYGRLGARNRTDALLKAAKLGLLE